MLQVTSNKNVVFKHGIVTQIVKIELALFKSSWLSIFFLKDLVGNYAVSMAIPTIAVTAVQVHLNPVHTEIC